MTTPTASEPITRSEFEQAMGRIDGRFVQLEARMEVRFAQLETAIERASGASIRWTVGMILPLYAFLFAFMLFIVGREFPR